jgi:regulator of sigma E protease
MILVKEILTVALMVFGFGFVVFFHELGHFLAAKWVGIRVEQFAVGFGQALFAWRKGIGWKVGTTNKELRRRAEEYLTSKEKDELQFKENAGYTDEQINKAADELGLGETEYRLNWIPLGGYVKMLGQDDLKANAVADDPNAYNRKTIGQRMVVVSAGVIMNIILAAIGFMVLFLMGFNAPPPVVGRVVANSPAQRAGIQVGDRVLTIDGTRQYDFTRITLSTALLKANQEVPIEIERPDPAHPGGPGQRITLRIKPERMNDDPKSILGIGIGPTQQLEGPGKEMTPEEFKELEDPAHFLPERSVLKLGDTIVAVEGKPVTLKQYYILDEALQRSNGKPVTVTIESVDHKQRTAAITPDLDESWGERPPDFVGMEPRPLVPSVPKDSSVEGHLKPGDVLVGIDPKDHVSFPTVEQIRELALQTADRGEKLGLTVLRDGKLVTISNIEPRTQVTDKRGKKHKGLGLPLAFDTRAGVSQVTKDSPAGRANIPAGATITAVDGNAVDNWFQVRTLLAAAVGKHKVTAVGENDKSADYVLELTQADVDALNRIRAGHSADLIELKEPRKTSNPAEAAVWGVIETRDLLLQFYVTITRMVQGSVSYTNMMGPLGIVTSGAHIAFKGMDWLLWFLAMISANLAVVNFLPIPIVDGGLFTFLILEKIQGKPLSPKVQAVAQIVGFALIISVFLLVTFQDLKRTIGF